MRVYIQLQCELSNIEIGPLFQMMIENKTTYFGYNCKKIIKVVYG